MPESLLVAAAGLVISVLLLVGAPAHRPSRLLMRFRPGPAARTPSRLVASQAHTCNLLPGMLTRSHNERKRSRSNSLASWRLGVRFFS